MTVSHQTGRVRSRLQVAEVEAGHDIAGENPQGFLAVLRPFLAKLEDKSHEHERR